MPIFDITNDLTGVTLEVEGDREPTQQEKIQLFQEFAPQGLQDPNVATIPQDTAQTTPQRRKEDLGFLDTLQGLGRLGAKTAIETGGRIAGGLAGLATGDPKLAEEVLTTVEDFSKSPFGIDIEGEEGRLVMESIADIAKEGFGFISDITPEPVKEFVSSTTGELIKGVKNIREEAFQRFGPEAATAVTVATDPEAILTLAPGGVAIKKARKMAVTVADDIADKAADLKRSQGINSINTGIPPEIKPTKEIVKDLKRAQEGFISKRFGRPQRAQKRIIKAIDPDPEILRSAQNLGVDLNPSHYSSNITFTNVERAVSSQLDSPLSKIEKDAFEKTSLAADRLITEKGGITDKSLLQTTVSREINDNINTLEKQSSIIFEKINQEIPKVTKVEANASREYINTLLNNFGGKATSLNSAEKRLLRLMRDPKNITYGALDRFRQDIGAQLGRKSNPFPDANKGSLDQLYKMASIDQQDVTEVFGIGAEYQVARKLVAQRKGIEEKAVELFGKDMRDSILPKLTQSATALTKGDISKFSNLMNAVPKNKRQAVAVSMLNELFTQGSRAKGFGLGEGFPNAFAALNRNKGAKRELFRHLPPGSEKIFDDIGRVSTGILRSKALQNNSKTARDVNALLESGKYLNLFKLATQVFLVEKVASAVGLGTGASGMISLGGTLLWNKVFDKGSAIKRTNELLTSRGFKQSLEDYAAGKTGKAEQITRTQAFKNWITAQPPDIKNEIATVGFVQFLLSNDDAEMTFENPPIAN